MHTVSGHNTKCFAPPPKIEKSKKDGRISACGTRVSPSDNSLVTIRLSFKVLLDAICVVLAPLQIDKIFLSLAEKQLLRLWGLTTAWLSFRHRLVALLKTDSINESITARFSHKKWKFVILEADELYKIHLKLNYVFHVIKFVIIYQFIKKWPFHVFFFVHKNEIKKCDLIILLQ